MSDIHGIVLSGARTRLHIPDANPSWKLMLQSGAGIPCTVGIPLSTFLREELGLSEQQLEPVEALLLDGVPVDSPEEAIVPDAARLALAAGLPGIAGLSMNKGSAVRALRSGLTLQTPTTSGPAPGYILLFLYSLVLPRLAPHFLRRGVIVTSAQLKRYSRFAPDDHCIAEGQEMSIQEFLDSHCDPTVDILLTAEIRTDN